MNRLAVAALLLGGCAAQHRAPESAAQSDPRAEIARLENRIAERRVELGLSSPAAGAALATEEESVAKREKPAEAPPPGAAPAPPADESPAPRARRLIEPSRRRCGAVSEAADEICDCAERICRLARELDEEDARRRCDAASLDCRNARTLARGCR